MPWKFWLIRTACDGRGYMVGVVSPAGDLRRAQTVAMLTAVTIARSYLAHEEG